MDLPELLTDGPADAPATVILAPGAGAPMDSPFMEAFAQGLAARGLRSVRFDFPYMTERRMSGKKRPPDRQPVLLGAWRQVIAHFGAANTVIGGKSMGGRMASLIARALEDEGAPVKGLVCLGYPFHPPGQPDKTRVEHLRDLKTPTLIVQGERDTFGTRAEVPVYPLAPSILVHWLKDGDHGFKPRKSSGRSEAQNWTEALDAMDAFVRAL